MKSSTHSPGRYKRRIVALLTFSIAANVNAAGNEDARRDEVSVHYVRLTGYGGDNELNRKNFADTYRACAATLPALGKEPAPLPANGIPDIILSEELEIYYAANRTYTVSRGTLHVVDPITCAIVDVPHHKIQIRSSIEHCDIDLIKRNVHGICHAQTQQGESASADGGSGVRLLSADRNAVPPAIRAQASRQIARLAELSRAHAGHARAGTPAGPHKNVAGMSCDVVRHAALQYELCIAHPASTPERRLNPDPIPAAPLNAGVPGLLLYAKTPPLTLTAQEVHLNQTVATALFEVPRDIASKTNPGSSQ